MKIPLIQKRVAFDLLRYEAELRELVNIDSGSYCLEGLGRIADWFAERLQRLGWRTEVYEVRPGEYGRSLYASCGGDGELDLLVLSHHDTVFPAGTVAQFPFAVTAKRYQGPGIADMKAGCLMALHAFEQLDARGLLTGRIGFFLNAEEEISCPTTRGFIEEKSRHARVVVSTEPGRADGSCVRQRKGISRYKLVLHGKSAHSGVAPQDGECAVTELARLILDLKAQEDVTKGITVNPGLIRGGISVNTVPERAECDIDIRVTEAEDGWRLDEWLRQRAAQPVNRSIGIAVSGGITRPPMIPNARADELIAYMNGIANGYGIDLSWSFSGGGSDASFASAMGKPTLCGLGPVGGGYHTEKEYLERDSLEQRMCMFRDFVHAVCSGKA